MIIAIAAVIVLRLSKWSDDGEKTMVTLTVNGKSVPSEFNSTSAAKEVIAKMPFTISFSSSDVDYCTSIDSLSYDQTELHAGWSKGYLNDVKAWKEQGSVKVTFELADELKEILGDGAVTVTLSGTN